MSYTTINFLTKKALKLHVQDAKNGLRPPVRIQQEPLGEIGNNPSHFSGTVWLEGPWFPQPHTWYAQAKVENGIVVEVK